MSSPAVPHPKSVTVKQRKKPDRAAAGELRVRLPHVVFDTGKLLLAGARRAGGQLSFAIGGYLSTAGLQVETASNLNTTAWQTVSSLPAAVSQPTFTISVSSEGRSVYFRVRNAGL